MHIALWLQSGQGAHVYACKWALHALLGRNIIQQTRVRMATPQLCTAN